jgi:glycosyltransferase involved in cell wall biosynthesis
MKKQVVIIWRHLTDYRIPFYCRLREYLLQRGIELQLIYGPTKGMGLKGDAQIAQPWAKCINHRIMSIGGVEICWQPYWPYVRDVDLIIVEQANRLLLNYSLIVRRRFVRQKIAFWGHGRDLQTVPNTVRNAWKRFFVKHVDWWFAYSEEVKQELLKCDFPAEKITNVQNSIDTDRLCSVKTAISLQHLESLRKELGLGAGPIGIYCGRMYKEKRVDFLLDACFRLKTFIPNFELIVIGSGPEEAKILRAKGKAPWIHYLGPKFEDERVAYFLLADVCLMPGAVGLAIIDCFALEVPMVTTKFPYHGPEIAYLKNGYNGLMTEDTVPSYVASVSNLLADGARLARLKKGCREAASVYTMQTMVENFGNGVTACLEV